jgi:hypothetical protein
MGGLLTIQGKSAHLRAKTVHISGHLPIPFGKAAWQHIDAHTPDAASIARRDSIPAGLTRKGRQENCRTFFSKDIS